MKIIAQLMYQSANISSLILAYYSCIRLYRHQHICCPVCVCVKTFFFKRVLMQIVFVRFIGSILFLDSRLV